MNEEDLPADMQEESGPVRTELERLTDDYLQRIGTSEAQLVLDVLVPKIRA